MYADVCTGGLKVGGWLNQATAATTHPPTVVVVVDSCSVSWDALSDRRQHSSHPSSHPLPGDDHRTRAVKPPHNDDAVHHTHQPELQCALPSISHSMLRGCWEAVLWCYRRLPASRRRCHSLNLEASGTPAAAAGPLSCGLLRAHRGMQRSSPCSPKVPSWYASEICLLVVCVPSRKRMYAQHLQPKGTVARTHARARGPGSGGRYRLFCHIPQPPTCHHILPQTMHGARGGEARRPAARSHHVHQASLLLHVAPPPQDSAVRLSQRGVKTPRTPLGCGRIHGTTLQAGPQAAGPGR
jgi:hypothetical protein